MFNVVATWRAKII